MSDFERDVWLAMRATKSTKRPHPSQYRHVSTTLPDRETGRYRHHTLTKGANKAKRLKAGA